MSLKNMSRATKSKEGKGDVENVWSNIDPENLFSSPTEAENILEHSKNLMMYGIASSDKRGHYSSLSFHAQPIFSDLLEAVYESLPRGWVKSKSALLRNAAAAGIYMFIEIARRYKKEIGEHKAVDNVVVGGCENTGNYNADNDSNVDINTDKTTQNIKQDNVMKFLKTINALNVIGKKFREEELTDDIDKLGSTIKFSLIPQQKREDLVREIEQLYSEAESIFNEEYGQLSCEKVCEVSEVGDVDDVGNVGSDVLSACN